MKVTISVFSALAALALSAQAATITVSNLPNSVPVPILSGCDYMLANGTVGIGTFTGDVHALAAAHDVHGLQAAFQQFGDSVSLGFNNIAGLYQNTISDTVGGTNFSGQNVYTVIGTGSDVQGGSLGLVVFDHGFPFKDEPDFTDDAILMADGNLIFGFPGQGEVRGQSFDGFHLGLPLSCPPIPESSSALLSLVGLSFLILRRRKEV